MMRFCNLASSFFTRALLIQLSCTHLLLNNWEMRHVFDTLVVQLPDLPDNKQPLLFKTTTRRSLSWTVKSLQYLASHCVFRAIFMFSDVVLMMKNQMNSYTTEKTGSQLSNSYFYQHVHVEMSLVNCMVITSLSFIGFSINIQDILSTLFLTWVYKKTFLIYNLRHEVINQVFASNSLLFVPFFQGTSTTLFREVHNHDSYDYLFFFTTLFHL